MNTAEARCLYHSRVRLERLSTPRQQQTGRARAETPPAGIRAIAGRPESAPLIPPVDRGRLSSTVVNTAPSPMVVLKDYRTNTTLRYVVSASWRLPWVIRPSRRHRRQHTSVRYHGTGYRRPTSSRAGLANKTSSELVSSFG